MMRLLPFAVWVVRAWTRVYTWRLPPSIRTARRAEIDSDLWELLHDNSTLGLSPALHILLRLVLGIPDDLQWRAANASLARRPLRTAAGAAGVVALLAAVWFVTELLGPQNLPHAPATPLRFVHGPPPGPPPPPPPPPRAQLRQ